MKTKPEKTLQINNKPVGEVVWRAGVVGSIKETIFYDETPAIGTKIYTSPAKLTDVEIMDVCHEIFRDNWIDNKLFPKLFEFADALFNKTSDK